MIRINRCANNVVKITYLIYIKLYWPTATLMLKLTQAFTKTKKQKNTLTIRTRSQLIRPSGFGVNSAMTLLCTVGSFMNWYDLLYVSHAPLYIFSGVADAPPNSFWVRSWALGISTDTLSKFNIILERVISLLLSVSWNISKVTYAQGYPWAVSCPWVDGYFRSTRPILSSGGCRNWSIYAFHSGSLVLVCIVI